MATIDSDAHVIETARTWDYLEGADAKYRPISVAPTSPGVGGQEWWLVDGHVFPGRTSNVGLDLAQGSRELTDVDVRLRHMDALGVDVQVLYPSIFIFPITGRPEVEVALCRAYNRWLADVWAQAQDRLRWVVMAPWMSPADARDELRFGKEHGACGVFMRGYEGERRPNDPYFFPLYEEAQRLDLPICFHAAQGNPSMYEFFMDDSGFSKFKFPVVSACHQLVLSDVPERFPRLRFGFLEVRAQWVPYVVCDLQSRLSRRGRPQPENLLRENRLYVACQTDDDLPYVLKYAGEDNILIGTDYGHADSSTEVEALRRLRETGAVERRAIDKILDDNARAFYGI